LVQQHLESDVGIDRASVRADICLVGLVHIGEYARLVREHVLVDGEDVRQAVVVEVGDHDRLSVGRAEAGSITSQVFSHADTNEDGDWSAPASQLDLDAGFGLVDDAGKTTSTVDESADGVPEFLHNCHLSQSDLQRCWRRQTSVRCS
jgi:hypothetical protein